MRVTLSVASSLFPHAVLPPAAFLARAENCGQVSVHKKTVIAVASKYDRSGLVCSLIYDEASWHDKVRHITCAARRGGAAGAEGEENFILHSPALLPRLCHPSVEIVWGREEGRLSLLVKIAGIKRGSRCSRVTAQS